MKKIILLALIASLFATPLLAFAQEEVSHEGILVLHKAQKRQKDYCAVIVYLIEDILEVTIIATMYATKPHVYNVTFVGPGVGRMSPQERQTLMPTVEDKELLFVTRDKEGGILRFSKRESKKKIKGTLTKELVKFKIPTDKIKEKKRYELKIKIESSQRPGQFKNFDFDLEKLHEAIAEQKSE
ncbi:MAG: hypothetical protein ABH954_02945 [Candidatus Omnitrophota bacterium]